MKPLPDKPKKIIQTLKDAGFDAYAVGGSVRDLLMEKPTRGWDFTTNARPEEIVGIFPDSFYDNTFGTVGIKIYDPDRRGSGDETRKQALPEPTGQTDSRTDKPDDAKTDSPDKPVDIYEITTFRSEGKYSDFRHPDRVSWGTSIEEDLSRRDFTINAIAYDGASFVDPYGGRADIDKKLVQTVGNPHERFREDALRMLRAVRIAAQLGFMIEQSTLSAIEDNTDLLDAVSAERIRDEFLKIISSKYSSDGILIMKNSRLLAKILPELERAFSVPQKSPKRHHIYDVGTHSVMSLKHCPSLDPIVRLATLIHDLGKVKTYHVTQEEVITFYNHEVVGSSIAKNISERLRLSKKDSIRLVKLVRWHQFSVNEHQTDSAIRRFIRRIGKENIADMLDLRTGDRLGGGSSTTSWRLEVFKKRVLEVQKQPFSIPDLKVDGHDVMEIFSIQPGPAVGTVLEALFRDVEKQNIPNEREPLVQRLREMKESGDTGAASS